MEGAPHVEHDVCVADVPGVPRIVDGATEGEAPWERPIGAPWDPLS